MSNFNFEEFAELYKTKPDEFEKKRISMLEAFIESAAEEHRHGLRQTLFRIEMIRKTSKSPLQSALNASKLMWESSEKLSTLIKQASEMVNEPKQAYSRPSLRLVREVNQSPKK